MELGEGPPVDYWSAVPDHLLPVEKVELGTASRRKEKWFVPPVPRAWFDRACVLPGKALAVGLVIWRLSRVKRANTFILTQAALEEHGLSRWVKRDALRALQDAGLIVVRSRGRKSPEVTVLDTPTHAA